MEDLISILCWILALVSVAILVLKLVDFFEAKQETHEYKIGKACLTFNQFLSFYNISPDRFDFQDNFVYIRMSPDCGMSYIGKFFFKTFGDEAKYRKFIEKMEKYEAEVKQQKIIEKRKKESTQEIVKLITTMQSDINKEKIKAQKMINSAICDQKEIMENIHKDICNSRRLGKEK